MADDILCSKIVPSLDILAWFNMTIFSLTETHTRRINEVPYVCIMAKVRTMDLWKICTCFRPRLGALLFVVICCCRPVVVMWYSDG